MATQVKKRIGYKSPPPADPAKYGPLNASDLSVLYTLTDLATKQGSMTIQVSNSDIALKIGTTRRQVTKSIGKLIDNENIVSMPTIASNGGKGANRYTILNPDKVRREKVDMIVSVSGLPMDRVIDYCYWLNFSKDKLSVITHPRLSDFARLSKCPFDDAGRFVEGLIASGVLVEERVILW